LAQAFSRTRRSLNPTIVYLYKDNRLVEGSPFSKYSDVHKTLGLNPSSNTCNRYLDTGKLYKNRYLFSSTPLNFTVLLTRGFYLYFYKDKNKDKPEGASSS